MAASAAPGERVRTRGRKNGPRGSFRPKLNLLACNFQGKNERTLLAFRPKLKLLAGVYSLLIL